MNPKFRPGSLFRFRSFLSPFLAHVTFNSTMDECAKNPLALPAANPMTDVVERVNDIYLAVVESEECMERIACEIGGLAADVGLKENAVAK